jgi:WD40 repeat protein
VIAFDVQGEFFAAADESGKVAVYPFRPPAYPKQAYAVIEKPSRLGPRPLALAFDQRRRWLAGVRGTELIVWNLQSPWYERQLEVAVGSVSGLTASLAFDPSGNLLGVGTANGWQIWDVKDKKLLAQGTGQVYAVTFSPDGRLFAWGDANGVVHLWGVPEK